MTGSRSARLPHIDTSKTQSGTLQSQFPVDDHGEKEDGPPDWYVEGPGRRVGYDDLTAIDWIYEYTKERQRLRKLISGSHGLVGNLRQLFDASHVWLVLVATGISVGCVAAAINIASDWLGDIKTGYCKNGVGGGQQFYLNKQFCCWGHDELAQCQDWTPWPVAMGVGTTGGQYVISYIFFILFSVGFIFTLQQAGLMIQCRYCLPFLLQSLLNTIRIMQSTVAFQKSKLFWVDSL